METHIDVKASGDRPTQVHCVKVDGRNRKTIRSSIAPDCAYKIRITSDKKMTGYWTVKGQGTITIRVHGFKKKDFEKAPEVIVKYIKDGQLIGKTQIEPEPLPPEFNAVEKDSNRVNH